MPVSLFLAQNKQMFFLGSRRLREGQVSNQGNCGNSRSRRVIFMRNILSSKRRAASGLVSEAARRKVGVRR